ncbi:MAG: hypothetical protein L0211_13550 [Planctomycetaceae bacterium]|nr:hypothetical protein [Planctomycetaceae bacterium]
MKFNIRDILWLTILAAVAVAWWLDHGSGSVGRQRLRRELFAVQRANARLTMDAIDQRAKILTAKVRAAQREAEETAR